MSLAASLIARPFALLLLIATVAALSSLIRRALPAGRVKRFLTRPMPMVPRTEAERRDWWPVVAWFTAAAIVWGALIGWVARMDGH